MSDFDATAGPGPACVPDDTGSCALCGDVAEPGRVLAVDSAARVAHVDLAGRRAAVAVDLIDEPRVGDVVLVHQGFAIAVVGGPSEGGAS